MGAATEGRRYRCSTIVAAAVSGRPTLTPNRALSYNPPSVAILTSDLQADAAARRRAEHWRGGVARLREEEERLRAGGGARAQERQREQGKLTARERVAALCDPGTPFLELGLWAAHGHVRGAWAARRRPAWSPGIGAVHGRDVVVVADDADASRPAPSSRSASRRCCARRRSRSRTGCRSSTWSTRRASSCRCRTRSSPTASTTAASSTTTPGSRPPASSRWRRSWARAWPAAPTCRS